MKRDFRTVIILLVFGLPVLAVLFFGSIYLYNCGIYADCSRGYLAPVIHTPIPTLLPATFPAPTRLVYSTQTAEITPEETEMEVVPEPSNPGPPGEAVNLKGDSKAGETVYNNECAVCHGPQGKGGVPNPGSDDQTVPPLNPIDPMLTDPVYKTFATNIDLYIQHGSVPEGEAPYLTMPGWGDRKAITQQQIADVIAYIISLNK
jgi:mono/diheme cytochrome c family protein